MFMCAFLSAARASELDDRGLLIVIEKGGTQ